MRPWYLVAVKARGDLAEALAGEALAVDAHCDLGWDGWLASPRRRLDSRSRGASPLSRESLELVDGNQAGTPGQLDRLDVREQAAEGRAADAKRLGGLAAGVGEPFHLARFAHHHPRWRRRRRRRRTSGPVSRSETAARFVRAALLAAAGHVYNVHELWDDSAPRCICVTPAIAVRRKRRNLKSTSCQRSIAGVRLRPCSSSISLCRTASGWASCSRSRAASIRA